MDKATRLLTALKDNVRDGFALVTETFKQKSGLGGQSVREFLRDKSKLTHAGFLRKRSSVLIQKNYKWKHFFVVIANGHVYYYKDEFSDRPSGCFSLVGYQDVRKATKESANDVSLTDKDKKSDSSEESGSENVPFAFLVIPRAPDLLKTHRFAAQSEEETKLWMNSFATAIRDANENPKSSLSTPGKRSSHDPPGKDELESTSERALSPKIAQNDTEASENSSDPEDYLDIDELYLQPVGDSEVKGDAGYDFGSLTGTPAPASGSGRSSTLPPRTTAPAALPTSLPTARPRSANAAATTATLPLRLFASSGTGTSSTIDPEDKDGRQCGIARTVQQPPEARRPRLLQPPEASPPRLLSADGFVTLSRAAPAPTSEGPRSEHQVEAATSADASSRQPKPPSATSRQPLSMPSCMVSATASTVATADEQGPRSAELGGEAAGNSQWLPTPPAARDSAAKKMSNKVLPPALQVDAAAAYRPNYATKTGDSFSLPPATAAVGCSSSLEQAAAKPVHSAAAAHFSTAARQQPKAGRPPPGGVSVMLPLGDGKPKLSPTVDAGRPAMPFGSGASRPDPTAQHVKLSDGVAVGHDQGDRHFDVSDAPMSTPAVRSLTSTDKLDTNQPVPLTETTVALKHPPPITNANGAGTSTAKSMPRATEGVQSKTPRQFPPPPPSRVQITVEPADAAMLSTPAAPTAADDRSLKLPHEGVHAGASPKLTRQFPPPPPQPSPRSQDQVLRGTQVREQSPAFSGTAVGSSFYWRGSKEEANRVLRGCKEDGVFLVRDSSDTDMKVLCISALGQVHSLKVYQHIRPGSQITWSLAPNGEGSFSSIDELVSYHQREPIAIRDGSVTLKLRRPFASET